MFSTRIPAISVLLGATLLWADVTVTRKVTNDKLLFTYLQPTTETISITPASSSPLFIRAVVEDSIIEIPLDETTTFQADCPFTLQARKKWDDTSEASVTVTIIGADLSEQEVVRITLSDSLESGASVRKRAVDRFIRNNPQQAALLKTRENGRREMVAVEDGVPIFVENFNIDAATSSHINALHPNGALGLNLAGKTLPPFGLWDDGIAMVDHQEYAGRVISGGDTDSTALHGTHVAGTIIGSGVLDPRVRGVAYEGRVKSYGRGDDLMEMHNEAYENGMLVSQHSYGWTITGDYRKEWDLLAYHNPHYFISKSAGNYGQKGFRTVARYSNSKNIMTVGNVDDLKGGYSSPSDVILDKRSSKGPTHDGRIKPDICANGVEVWSACGWGPDKIVYYSGTSMSGPVVAASAGLLQEHYYNTHNKTFMEASTIKALMINSAFEAGKGAGPDYRFGWGVLNGEGAAQLISFDAEKGGELLVEKTLKSGESKTFSFKALGEGDIRATIAWHDPAPEGDSIFEEAVLVHDLDLKITVDGEEFLPWVLNPDSVKAVAAKGDNSVDNVERVDVKSLAKGEKLTVTISHKGNLVGSQPFSFVISGVEPVDGTVPITSSSKNAQKKPSMHIWGRRIVLKNCSFQNQAKVEIYSLKGEKLRELSVDKNGIAHIPHNFSSALYIARYSNRGDVIQQKVVIE